MAVQPGEAAPAVAAQERAAHCRRDAAGSAPDAERLAVGTIHHGDDARIAAQPSGGLRRDGSAVLDFAASGPAVGEHFGLDMYDDFVAVRCERRRIARFEHPLGHPCQRIGAAHGARRSADERPTWDVGQKHLGVLVLSAGDRFPSLGVGRCISGRRILDGRPTWDVHRSGALVVPSRRRLLRRMRRHRRIERAQDARTHLGREPPVEHHGPVVLVPEGKTAVLVLGIGPLGLFGALRPPMKPNELLDMLCGAVQSDVEEVGFVPGGGDAGEGTHLGVAELALGQRLGEQRQLGQCPGDSDFLPGGMGIDAAGPAQPVGAGQRPLVSPDLAAVELGNEGKKAVCGGVDVGGEGGDGGGKGVVVHGGEIVSGDGVDGGHGTKKNR